MNSFVALQGLSRSFGDIHAVRDLTFEVGRGEGGEGSAFRIESPVKDQADREKVVSDLLAIRAKYPKLRSFAGTASRSSIRPDASGITVGVEVVNRYETNVINTARDALRLAEIVAPKLMQDGMYLAGLDIVGDKMMEINVDTPGGINMAEELTGADFSGYIIGDLERKVQLRDLYNRTLSNTELAMM